MRLLFFIISSGWLISPGCPSAFPEDDHSTYRADRIALDKQLGKPLIHWLSELASADDDRMKVAIAVLDEIACIVSFADFKLIADPESVRDVTGFVGDDIPGPARRDALANQYRQELRESLPAMIRQLSQLMSAEDSESHADAVEALATCITVTFPDGSGLVQARRELPPSMEADELIHLLFKWTALTLPADRTLYSIVIPETQKLSEETKTWLRAEWDRVKDIPLSEEPFAGLNLGFAPMVLMTGISSRNRVFEELPIFTEFLKPEYPQLLRCASLVCLAECGFFAESALPDVRSLLNDESPLIRIVSVSVVVAIALDAGELSELADKAGLEGAARLEFIAASEEMIGNNFDEGTLFSIEKLIRDERDEHKGAIELKSTRLWALRCVRHFRSRAGHLEPFVKECLIDQDDAIRKAAELAMKAIVLPAPAPRRDGRRLLREAYNE